MTHSRSDESKAKRPCSPLTSPYKRHRPPSTRPISPFPQHQLSRLRPLAPCHLALHHGMPLALFPSTRAIADIDSLNALSPKPAFLHSTPGIFYGSSTTRTGLNRATALDARWLVSENRLRGGCRFLSAAQCLQAHGLIRRASLPSLGVEASTFLKADLKC